MEIYSPFSIVVVPFPFTDKAKVKHRPALVISAQEHQKQTNHISLLMITSAKNSSWPSDYVIHSLQDCGLSAPSIVRQKIFTLDNRLIVERIGELSSKDKNEVLKRLRNHISILPLKVVHAKTI